MELAQSSAARAAAAPSPEAISLEVADGAHGGLRQYWDETLHGMLPASGMPSELDFLLRQLDEDADGVLSPRESAVGAFHLLAAACQRDKRLGVLLGAATPWASLRNYMNLGTPSSLMNVDVIRRVVLHVASELEKEESEQFAAGADPPAARTGLERFVAQLERCCARLLDQEFDFSVPKCKLTKDEARLALYRGVTGTVVALYAKRDVAQTMGRFKWLPLALLFLPVIIAVFPFILAFLALRSRSRTGAKQAGDGGFPGGRFLFWIYIIVSYYVAMIAIAMFHRNTKVVLPGEPEPQITMMEAWTPMVLLLFVGVTISGWQDRSLTWLFEAADPWFETAKMELLEVEFTPEAAVSLASAAGAAVAPPEVGSSHLRQPLGAYCSELLAVQQNVLPHRPYQILLVSALVAVVHGAVPTIYRVLDTGKPLGIETWERVVSVHFIIQGFVLVTAFFFVVIETVAEYTNQRALVDALLAQTDATRVAAWKALYEHFLEGSERYIADRRGLASYDAAKELWGSASPVFPGVLDLRTPANLDAFLHLRRRLVAHGIDTQSQWAIFGCFITPIALAALVFVRVVFFAAEPKIFDVHVLTDLVFFFFVLLWLVKVMVDSNLLLDDIIDRLKQLQRRLARAFEATILRSAAADAGAGGATSDQQKGLVMASNEVVRYMARRDRLSDAVDASLRLPLVTFPVIRLVVTKTFLTSIAASAVVAVLPQLQAMLASLSEKQIPT